ncbi:MAG: hypothetical protein CML19_09125 [Pusillimonas sp.]|nr:hypothetical protein [Pusillimonas sp.]HCP76218.1 hypothetical protein [Pusillimonas sp.]
MCRNAGLSDDVIEVLLTRLQRKLQSGVDRVTAQPVEDSGRVIMIDGVGYTVDQIRVAMSRVELPEGYALAWIDRTYDQRVQSIMAFNTCAGDLDDKLDAAYRATLEHSPTPAPDGQKQQEVGNV